MLKGLISSSSTRGLFRDSLNEVVDVEVDVAGRDEYSRTDDELARTDEELSRTDKELLRVDGRTSEIESVADNLARRERTSSKTISVRSEDNVRVFDIFTVVLVVVRPLCSWLNCRESNQ